MYVDDGITLDYDRLTQLYPPDSPSISKTQALIPNTQKRKSLRPNNQKETGKISNSSIMKDLTTKTQIKTRNRPPPREEQHELFPLVEKDTELEHSTKKDGGSLELRSTRSTAKNTMINRKKVKPDLKDSKQQHGDLELDVDSTKETTAYSVNSDTINDNPNENEVHNNEEIMISESAKVLKKRGRKRKIQEPVQVKKSLEMFEVDKTPCYLLNPIPNFFDKFKTENIHYINKLFYFDPVQLSL